MPFEALSVFVMAVKWRLGREALASICGMKRMVGCCSALLDVAAGASEPGVGLDNVAASSRVIVGVLEVPIASCGCLSDCLTSVGLARVLVVGEDIDLMKGGASERESSRSCV